MDYKELINRLRYNWVCPDDIADAVIAIETLLAERDAAVEDLRVGGCEVCKYKDFWGYDVPCRFCKEIGGMSDYWQWRGPQKGDGHGS